MHSIPFLLSVQLKRERNIGNQIVTVANVKNKF